MVIQPEKLQSLRVYGTQADIAKIVAFLNIVQRNPADADHKVSFALMNQEQTVDWIRFEANALWNTVRDAIQNSHK